ncbi:A/G-specific adenine glycosylase [Raineyella antarctica]|uniref:A/G-specific adenine glycosylase n=1 Tax=Raineyella antarctica TaxID=1577474 RepID=UPI000B8644CE|nr:A/G-specific adenine glycosylase [Raineyella antarctica]
MVARTLDWYAGQARDLPWRRPDCSPWGVMVSEFMLQQTPVTRVLGPWQAWLDRWPTPAALAASPAGEAVRMWGRLGYPRRALRLHRAAQAIVDDHGGQVPADLEELRALPGVGDYTAAAVASFAHGRRAVVLDTNVRRVLSRVAAGEGQPPAHVRASERARAEAHLPRAAGRAARWAAASMELGALVCTARNPRCEACPLVDLCTWNLAGRPEETYRPRTQSYEGTDRQCRGAVLAVLRDAAGPVATTELRTAWPEHRAGGADQFERALTSLAADGLVTAIGAEHWALPGD